MLWIKVRLFGRFRVWYNGEIVTGLDARRAQELLAYLLLYRDRSHTREALIDLLWGDQPAAQGKKCLRQGLWQLQTALENCSGLDQTPVVLVESDWVRLNKQANLQVDVATFEQAFNLAKGAPGAQLDGAVLHALQEAVELYQGDLLDGWYYEWLLYERERFQSMYLMMLDKLMEYCEAHQEYDLGLDYGRRILRYDRARERTHQNLMRLYYLSGDRAGALRQYERCVAALDEELKVKASKTTLLLYSQIQSDHLDTLGPGKLAPLDSVHACPLLDDVVNRLKQLQSALTDLQNKLEREIETVEDARHTAR